MKPVAITVALSVFALPGMILAGAASAQTEVQGNLNGGLHYHIAAPETAGWTLRCRFRTITVRGVPYNTYNQEGRGARAGRLPGDNGQCRLTLVEGAGPIGFALVKNGAPTAAGSNDPARPAIVNVF